MTLSTKRPGATTLSSGITLFGGAGTLHATLSDNSDATYAAMASSGQGEVTFDTLSVPAGAILQSVVLRARCRRAAAGTIIFAALDTGPTIQFHPPTGSGWTTLASVSQTTVTSAALAAGVSFHFIGQPGTSDLAAAYLDITYIPLPTLNVTAPTGTIAVTRPAVVWTYTGDYPQERFRIKVFSSAQYGAVGFNVDTSTPLYDSGEQVSAAHSYTPTLNLPNSDTYRFYVKVAQKVGATTQWSAWDNTQPTVAVTPAAVPTLTVTAESLSARIKLVATITGSPTWDYINIQRTNDGGITWTPIRNADRMPVSGTSFTLYDYESGNGQTVRYRVQSVVDDPAGDIASNWSASTAAVSWAANVAVLKSLTQPTLSRFVVITDIPTVTRRIPRNVVDIAGRRDPIVVSDTRRWVEGTVTFFTTTDAQRNALVALLDTSETLLLETPATWGFGSRYISCGDEEEARTSPNALETSRLFTVPFNEVSAPAGQVITFGSSWDDLVAAYATWTAVKTALPTWNAVVAAHL